VIDAPDFFAFEDRLQARLKDTLDVPPTMQWLLSSSPEEAEEKLSQIAPAIHIIYGGYRPREGSSARQGVIEQTWIVVVSVKSAAGGKDQRVKAGPILGQILRALMGWPVAHRDEQFGPLKLVPAGGVRRRGIVAHYPLAFTTSMPVQGQPD
jgi:hypothetical protein